MSNGVIALSRGNTVYDKTHVVVIDQSTCSVRTVRVAEPAILKFSATDTEVVTSNVVNGVTEVHRHSLVGGEDRQASFPGEGVEGVAHLGDSVVLLTRRDPDPGPAPSMIVRLLSGKDLSVTRQFEVPLASGGAELVVRGDKVLVGETVGFDDEAGRVLAEIDVVKESLRRIRLDQPLPYWL